MFSAQLEKSRDATTAANLRSAYAMAVAAYISDDDTADGVAFDDTDDHSKVTVSNVTLLDTDGALGDAGNDLPFSSVLTGLPGTKKTTTITFTFADSGAISSAKIN